jgi:hypothetical protein
MNLHNNPRAILSLSMFTIEEIHLMVGGYVEDLRVRA